MKTLNVIGIMNGTSLDGVDYVLCRIKRVSRTKVGIQYLDQAHSPFPNALRDKLAQAARHKLNMVDLALLHHELGRFYADDLSQHRKKRKWKPHLIGLHGQTVFHQPPEATLQIGESSYLAQVLGVPVACDFRVADLAAGGQAAPLAPLFHQIAFSEWARKPLAVQNLGGIANVTYLHKKHAQAFDTGPANMLMDLAVQRFSSGRQTYDHNGEWAAKGTPSQDLVAKWLKHPYFAQKPPKSCGREQFGEVFLDRAFSDMKGLSQEDMLSTLTEFTAASIVDQYQRFLPALPQQLLLCGGGARNLCLKTRLQEKLPNTLISTTDQAGWPDSAIEGAAFALLAAWRYWQIPSDTRPFTGAKKPIVLGKI